MGVGEFPLDPFNSSMHQLSFDVSIVNDNVTEDAETFTARLTLDPADQARLGSRVTVLPDVATVTINDNDGRQSIHEVTLARIAVTMNILRFYNLIYLSDVVVGFVQRSYSEDEDVGTFSVCVAVTMPLDTQPLERMSL